MGNPSIQDAKPSSGKRTEQSASLSISFSLEDSDTRTKRKKQMRIRAKLFTGSAVFYALSGLFIFALNL